MFSYLTVLSCCALSHTSTFTNKCEVAFLTEPSGAGSITLRGDGRLIGTFTDGDTDAFSCPQVASVTANVPEGYRFDRWEATDNVEVESETGITTTVRVTGGGTLKAVFAEIPEQPIGAIAILLFTLVALAFLDGKIGASEKKEKSLNIIHQKNELPCRQV